MFKPALITAVVLLGCLVAQANSNAAAIVGGKAVLVNGLPIAGKVVFSGDIIRNNNSTSIQLITDGTRMMIAPGTQFMFHSMQIGFISGAASIATSSYMPVEIGDVPVFPISDTETIYAVKSSGKKVYVSVQKGAVEIVTSKKTIRVNAGRYAFIEGNGSPRTKVVLLPQNAATTAGMMSGVPLATSH